jgi:hypothetical protein
MDLKLLPRRGRIHKHSRKCLVYWRGIRLWEQPCLRALAWQPSDPVPVAADQAGNDEFALALHASIFVALDQVIGRDRLRPRH